MPAGSGKAWPGFEPTRRATHQQPSPTGVEGAGGHKRARLRRPWTAPTPPPPNFARNLTRSFFETPQKRCNSNDANSMFE